MTTVDDLYGDDGHVPGDFRRNKLDQPLVKAPDGNRKLAYDRFSNWPFDDYTGIDPIYAQRGTWVHKLTELIDLGEPVTNDFHDEGIQLGIPLEVQGEIANGWRRFREAHGLEAVAVEVKAVCDTFRTAGTIDRIDRHNGCLVAADVKTSSSVERLGYACQLVYAAHSVPYDVDSDERGQWPGPVSTTVAYVYHYPLNRRLKGEQVEWTLVECEPPADIAASLYALRHPIADQVSDMFTRVVGLADIAPTLDELRARVATWELADRQGLADMMTRESIDRTDPEQVAAAIDRYHFADVVTEPEPRPAPVEPEAVIELTRQPDEGGDTDPAAVEAIKARYENLADKAALHAWAKQAQQGSAPFTLSTTQTVRRLRCMTVAVMLTEQGFDSDSLRGVLRHVIGDMVDMPEFTAGALLGSLNADEAARAVEVAGVVCDGMAPMAIKPDGRVVFEVAA